MKRLFSTLLTMTVVLSTSLQAYDNDLSYDSSKLFYPEDELIRNEEDEKGGAIQISATADYIGSSKFDKKRHHPRLKHQRNHYNEESVEGLGVFYYNPIRKEGLGALGGYTHTEFKWKQNPYFHQRHFHTINAGIVGFSHRLCDWMWKGQVNFNFDVNHFRWSQYVTADLFFWGRYEYSRCVGFDIGLIALTGMKIDHVYPIIGFDWRINEQWKLNAVFPTDVSLVYQVTKDFQLAVAGRVFYSRHRVGRNEPVPRALIQYQNYGVEFGVTYDPQNLFCWLADFDLNLHIGYAGGGRVKIANRHYHHSHRFFFNGAPYAGGELSVKF